MVVWCLYFNFLCKIDDLNASLTLQYVNEYVTLTWECKLMLGGYKKKMWTN
jgi:hypothetical protein